MCQRGSPPQADAEGLVVDSPQDEGCPGRMQCAPTYIRRDGAAERCRGLGCPQNLESPPKNGGQEVDDHRLERGPGGFRGHDRAWPSEDWFRIPAPRFHEDGLRGNDRREAQDTSGPRLGCPQIEIVPPRWNTRLRRMPRVWGCPPITRRAGFHGLCPWGNENSPVGRQAKLVIKKCHGLCPWVSTSLISPQEWGSGG
jgi:hypothetical protein